MIYIDMTDYVPTGREACCTHHKKDHGFEGYGHPDGPVAICWHCGCDRLRIHRRHPNAMPGRPWWRRFLPFAGFVPENRYEYHDYAERPVPALPVEEDAP